MEQTTQPNWRARILRGLVLISPACIAATAAMGLGGCVVHEHDVRVVHDRVYDAPPPPPPVVEETVVAEPVYAPPPTEVVTVYERDLNPYGHWVDIPGYGRCWVPNHRPDGWRPYTHGHWANCEQGWTFVSEDEDAQFGEVCYHYGRWYNAPSAGWCWVPGSVWGPSWCAWREGNGYCAWAPLPPQCVDGQVVDTVVVDRYVPRESYCCVEERYMAEPRIRDRVIVNNVTIINKTTNITNVTYVNNRAVNRGIATTNVERYTGHSVPRVQAARVTSIEEARRAVEGGRPAIYLPPEVDHYVKAHPVKVIPARHQVDQKTAEQLKAERDANEVHRAPVINPLAGDPEQERRARQEEKAAAEARLKQQKEAQEREARETAAQEKAAREKALRDRAAEEKATAERERAQHEADVLHQREEKAAQERAARENAASEKAAMEEKKPQRDADAARVRDEKLAQERASREKAASDKAAAEKAAADRVAAERAAVEKKKAQREADAARAREEKIAQERAAREKAASDKAAAEKAAAEKAAAERAAIEREKAQRQADAARAREEKLAQERAAREKAASDRAAAERAAAERAAAEKAAKERAEADKAAQRAAQRAAQEKAAQDKAARDKAAKDKDKNQSGQ